MADAYSVRVPGLSMTWRGYAESMPLANPAQIKKMIKACAISAAKAWRDEYIPRRFTAYARRAEFAYRDPDPSAKSMEALKRGHGELPHDAKQFVRSRFAGWANWPGGMIPSDLISGWMRAHKEKYKGITGPARFARIKADIRAWCREEFSEWARRQERAGKILPLVLSSDTRKTVMGGRIVASASDRRSRVSVSLPLPGPRNRTVGRVLRTVPPDEAEDVSAAFSAGIYATRGRINGELEARARAGAERKMRTEARKSAGKGGPPRPRPGRPARATP